MSLGICNWGIVPGKEIRGERLVKESLEEENHEASQENVSPVLSA